MIILAVQDIQKSFGTHEVLKSVSFTLQEQERMGLVGVNGSGKSTLMKIIAGIETADGGTVSIQKGLRIGYLAQQGEFREGETVRETLESVFEPLVQMEAEMRDLEQKMAEQGDDPEALRRLGGRYDALMHEFERRNGYGWRSQVQGVLAGLNLREYQDQPTRILSGGASLQALQDGEIAAAMILEESVLKKLKDAEDAGEAITNLRCIYPEDGVILIPSPVMTVAAEHSKNNNIEACKAVERWFLSEEAQKIILQGFMHSVFSDLKEIPYGSVETEELMKKDMHVKWENAYSGREDINNAWNDIVINRRAD